MTSVETRRRILEATLATLKERGFSGTTAREVAKAGGFNQALIFYHFGNLDGLLLAALDATSEMRMERYREVISNRPAMEELVAAAIELYREDLESGHITVLSEMIAGSLARPQLRPEILTRMEPWLDLVEEAIEAVLAPAGLGQLLPKRDLAEMIVAFYLGVEMLNHLGWSRGALERMSGLVPLALSFARPLLERDQAAEA